MLRLRAGGRCSGFPRPHRRGRIETQKWPGTIRARTVSPGLTAGGGLKLRVQHVGVIRVSFPRPHRRGRIETLELRPVRAGLGVSPGLTAGGGLKLEPQGRQGGVELVSPGLTAGGGLKPRSRSGYRQAREGFPRPHRRGRIETPWPPPLPVCASVSPGLTAGGGLKHSGPRFPWPRCLVSPGLTAGGGLKPQAFLHQRVGRQFPPASPPGAD